MDGARFGPLLRALRLFGTYFHPFHHSPFPLNLLFRLTLGSKSFKGNLRFLISILPFLLIFLFSLMSNHWALSVAQFGDFFSPGNLAEYEADSRMPRSIPRPDFAKYSFDVEDSADSESQNLMAIGFFPVPYRFFLAPIGCSLSLYLF